MKEILRLTLSIGLVCLIGGAALAYVNVKTDGPRQEAAAKTLVDSLKLVLPPETASTTKAASVDGVDFYDAQDSAGRTIARAAVGSSSLGFGGEMKVLVGLSPDNRILGVMVTEHNETRLGTKATNRKRKSRCGTSWLARRQKMLSRLMPTWTLLLIGQRLGFLWAATARVKQSRLSAAPPPVAKPFWTL